MYIEREEILVDQFLSRIDRNIFNYEVNDMRYEGLNQVYMDFEQHWLLEIA